MGRAPAPRRSPAISFRRRRRTQFGVDELGTLETLRPVPTPRAPASYARTDTARSSTSSLAFEFTPTPPPPPAPAMPDAAMTRILGEFARPPAESRAVRAARNRLFPLAFIRVVQSHARPRSPPPPPPGARENLPATPEPELEALLLR